MSGEVKYPGIYTLIEKDERISSLIERAGGLTNYAHIDGIKMFRKFEVTEEEEQVDMSQRLKDSILSNPELAKIYFSEINQQKGVLACHIEVVGVPQADRWTAAINE